MGIMREMMNEIADPGSMNQVTDWIFRNSGLKVLPSFRTVDKLGKDVAINSAHTKAVKILSTRKGVEKMTKELSPAWGEDTPQLIKELKSGEITDIVKQYLFTRLSEMQPVSRTEMPESFLAMNNGRIYYQLLTWTMKQFSLFRKEALHRMAYGNTQEKLKGMEMMTKAIVFLGGANIASDEAKRFITNRDSAFTGKDMPTEVAGALLKNSTKNFLGSSDPFEQHMPLASIVKRIGQTGYQAATTEETTIGDFGAEAWRSMPILGKLTYMWLLGGAEEFNKKQEAKREASNKSQYTF